MFGFLSGFPAPLNSPIFFATTIGAALAYAAYSLTFKPTPKKIEPKKIEPKHLTELPQVKLDAEYRRGGDRRTSVVGESFNEEEVNATAKVVYPKSEETRKRIAERTSKLLLIRNLDRRQKEDIYDAMLERNVEAGELIIKQGEEGDFFYVVDSGHFEIIVNGNKVGESKPCQGFGELALLYNQPRAATVKATIPSVVWAVDRSTFRKIVLGSNARKRRQYQTFLKDVPILASITPEEIVKIVDALEPMSFKKGDQIIQEGQSGETFYIIEEGSVSVTIKGELVGSKTKGEYFGEIALLTDGLRVATVTADSDTDCLVLDKNAFARLLGPCVDILKRNMDDYKKYEKNLQGSN